MMPWQEDKVEQIADRGRDSCAPLQGLGCFSDRKMLPRYTGTVVNQMSKNNGEYERRIESSTLNIEGEQAVGVFRFDGIVQFNG
jgi:hypothetical protein